jgi:hypothetical protein
MFVRGGACVGQRDCRRTDDEKNKIECYEISSRTFCADDETTTRFRFANGSMTSSSTERATIACRFTGQVIP